PPALPGGAPLWPALLPVLARRPVVVALAGLTGLAVSRLPVTRLAVARTGLAGLTGLARLAGGTLLLGVPGLAVTARLAVTLAVRLAGVAVALTGLPVPGL